MQITMPYSGRLAGKSESFELLRSEDNALMFCNIRPKQPFNKPVHKTFGDEKKNSTCLSFRKHSLSNRALRTLAALGVLIRKAIATTIGRAYAWRHGVSGRLHRTALPTPFRSSTRWRHRTARQSCRTRPS